MLGSWWAEGAWGWACLPGVEGADSLCTSEAPSPTLASVTADLAVSGLGGGGTGIERGVARGSGAFLVAAGFSGDDSSTTTLRFGGEISPLGVSFLEEWAGNLQR